MLELSRESDLRSSQRELRRQESTRERETLEVRERGRSGFCPSHVQLKWLSFDGSVHSVVLVSLYFTDTGGGGVSFQQLSLCVV